MAKLQQPIAGFIRVVALSAGFTTFANVALAAPIAVVNSSFELPAAGPGVFITNAPPPGWAAYGDSLDFAERTIGVLNPSGTTLYVDPVPDGNNVGVTFLFPQSNDEAGLEQTLDDTLQNLTDYTLTVEVGNLANDDTPYDFDGFPGYRIELLAGSTVIASDDNTLLPDEGRFLASTLQVSTGAAHPNAGEPLGIRLVNLDASAGIEVNFDDVRLDAESAGACPAVPLAGCKSATATKGSLKISRKVGDLAKNRLSWTWKGQSTELMELGTPTSTTDYRLCVYDGALAVILDLPVPAGGSCGAKPCWKSSSNGFSYKNALATLNGVTDLALKSGADDKAAMKLKGKGTNLDLPTLPLLQVPDAVQVVLANESTGVCWTALYSAAPKDPASTLKWSVKND